MRSSAPRVEHVPREHHHDIRTGCLGAGSIVFARIGLLDDRHPVRGCLERHPYRDDERIVRTSPRGFEHDPAGSAPPLQIDPEQGRAQTSEKGPDLSGMHALQLRPNIYTRIGQPARELEQQALLPRRDIRQP